MQLRAKNPAMIQIHCICHRQALAAADAAKKVPYIAKTFKPNLRNIYYFFDKSPVCEAALHEIQELLGDEQLKLKNACDTRWLSTNEAVQTLRRSLPAVVTALEREGTERSDPTAIGLAKIVKNPKFVATLYFLCDVLPTLCTVSKVFQTTAIDFSLIQPTIEAATVKLEHLKEHPGRWETRLDAELDSRLKDVLPGCKLDTTSFSKQVS